MASPPGTASFSESGFSPCPSFAVRPHARAFPMANSSSICVVNCCLGKSTKILKQQNPIFFAATPRKNRGFTSHRSLELEQFVTSDDEDEMGDGFFEAIEELERMTREPSDVLEEMNNRLSARELQLVLVYFSQEGRDSWCALEVFEWLKKENRVDEETMELMVAIMCGWMRKLIEGEHEVNDVADLLVDMDCVGLKPSFSMFEKVISLYWEMEKKEKAVSFVKEVLRRGTMYSEGSGNDDEGHKGGPTGYLAWKMMVSLSYPSMCRGLLLVDDAITDLYVRSVTSDCLDTPMVMPFLSKRATQELSAKILSLDLVTLYCSKEVDGKYRDAVKLVIEIRESGLKPEVYSYLIAMTAIVKELNEVAKALRKLKGFAKSGLVASIDAENVGLVEQYRSDLLSDGVCLSKWVLEEGSPSIHGVVHERLLAMYICAGQGLEAESQLWQMKLVGKETDGDLRDIVLAICASQNEVGAIRRLLARSEVASSARKRKTFSWLLRGFIKGGHFNDAADTLLKMLDMGLYPDYLDRVAVLQGLRNGIQRSGDVDLYLNVCKRLADAHLIAPCLVYLHIKKHNLWIMRML